MYAATLRTRLASGEEGQKDQSVVCLHLLPAAFQLVLPAGWPSGDQIQAALVGLCVTSFLESSSRDPEARTLPCTGLWTSEAQATQVHQLAAQDHVP